MAKIKGFIVDSDYTNIDEETYVQLFGRLENGQSFVVLNKLKPYFFVKEKDRSKMKGFDGEFKIEDSKLTDFARESVCKIVCKNQEQMNKLVKELHEEEMDTFESDIRPYVRFMIDNDLKAGIEIDGEYESSERVDRVYRNADVSACLMTPKLKILSVDIETSGDGKKLFCIGMYSNKYKKSFIVGKSKVEDAICCKDEEECLLKFKEELKSFDPDIITGWNLIKFDLNYLNNLFKKFKIPFDIGRTNDNLRLKIESNFFRTSSANAVGRQIIDGLDFIRDPFIKEAPSIKNAKFESYTLENVAQEILGQGKLIKGDNRHIELERLYASDKASDLKKLLDYNMMDCELVYEILEKAKMIELAIERSELTGVTFDRLTASIAAFDSVYIREARKRGLVSPAVRFGQKEERLKGGYVYSSASGIFHNVLILDFKSLYPSIIKTFNIDPSSYLGHNLEKEKNVVETPNKVYFRNNEGILPQIISELHSAREKAKKEKRELSSYAIKIIMNSFWGVLASQNCRYFDFNMASSITSFARMIIQLTAKKIEERGYRVMYSDSVDGKTKIILKKGHVVFEENIENLFTKSKKTNLGKEYDFKRDLEVLTLDDHGHSIFKPIEYVMRHKCKKKMYRVNFTNKWYIDVTEDHSLMGYQSLAYNNKKENIANPLKRLVEIKPSEIKDKAGTIVSLKKIPNTTYQTKNYPKEVYEFMGYFIGDGSFMRNKLHKKYDKDYYLRLSLGLDREELLRRLIIPLKNLGYIKKYWLSATRKGDLTINGLQFVNMICKNFREQGRKVIPGWLFDEKEENIASFLRGLFSADGSVMLRNKAPIIKYTSINEEYIKEVRKLLYRVGISHSVFKENSVNKYKTKTRVYSSGSYSRNIIIQDKDAFAKKIGFILNRKNKLAQIKINPTQKRHIRNYEFDIQGVQSVEEIKSPEYVYDIEVRDTHRFFANYVLAHNTDSVFVEAGVFDLEKAEKLGPEIQDYINNFYKKYVKENYNRDSYLDLEFKKQYVSMMIPSLRKEGDEQKAAKKRYAGLVVDGSKESLEITGLEAIRGDWTEAAGDFQKELLMKVFKKQEVDVFIKGYVKEILAGKLDKKLVYRKSIRKELDEYTKTTPPHVKAARKLDSIESNIIEYFITIDGPEPIQKLKHKLDYEHYIDKQIKPIANQVLGLFNKSFEDVVSGNKQRKLF